LEWASPIQYLIPLSYQIENFNAMEAPTVEIIVIARKTSLLPLELHKGKMHQYRLMQNVTFIYFIQIAN
jgi:hypothetical protein